MKKLLILFAVLLTSVGAWAQPQVSDAPSNGQWAANTTWFQIKNQKNKVIRADVLTSEGYLALTNQNVIKSDVALWSIVGNETDGYKFYNRAIGPSKVLGMTGSGAGASAVFVAEGTDGYRTAFDIVASTDQGYWCMKDHGSANNYWNQRDPRLAYWASDAAQKGDDGSSFSFTVVDLSQMEYAPEDAITAAKAIIKKAPGYPKVTSAQYGMLNDLVNLDQVVVSDLTSAVSAYKTATDIIFPESGKAYTFMNVMGNTNRTKRYMKYENGKKVSVSANDSDASVFVCRQLRAGVYAFVTTDGKVLTWVGNNETYAYKENNNIYGYSSHYAAVYDETSDWNEISMEKYGASENNFGHFHLYARRKKGSVSALIVKHSANRFDQSGNTKYFGDDFSSAWILTEVEHSNTAEQTAALAEIDATVEAIAHVDANASKLRIAIGYASYMVDGTKTIDTGDVKTAINNATSADEVNTIKNSFAYEIPEAQTKYVLYDVAHKVFLDINNLATAPEQTQCTELAKLNSEKQSLYITASANQWKIHTTAEGGNYLGQYTDANQWNSRVHADLSDFEWEECPMDVDGEILYSLKNNSGKQDGYLGAGGHTNDKALFVNQSEGSNQLKLRLHKSDLVYKLVVNGHPTTYTIIYNEKKYNNGDFIFADDIIAEADITISELPGYNKALTIDEATKTVTVTFSIAVNFSEGDKIFIRNRDHANDYIFADFSGGKLDNSVEPTKKNISYQTKNNSNIDYRFCWELKATTHGNEQCFYLYNPYYDWYIGSIRATNADTYMSKTEEQAGKYKIEMEDNHFVFHCLTSTINAETEDGNFFHWYSWDGSKQIVGWKRSATASQWIIEAVTEDVELLWQNTLTSQFNALTQYEAGTGVGQYSGIPEELVEDFNALTLPEEASAIEKARYCVYALYEYGSAVDALTLNMPEAGFYRFKAYNTSKYLQNYSVNNNFQLKADKDVRSIMYLSAEKTILSYGSGQYANDHTNPVEIGTDALSWSIVENASVVGHYALDMANHGYLDIHDSWVASSGNNNEGTAWEIEPVETLPFTFNKAALGFATFNAPVAVQLPEGVLAYITDVNENILQMYRLEGSEIPANTPVMLYNEAAKADDAEDETTIGLRIVDSYSGAEDVEIAQKNDFYGTIAAETYPNDFTVYSLQKKQKTEESEPDMVGFYKKNSSTTLGGFKSWIKIAGENSARTFTIIFDGDDATGLKEALGIENENVEIYDLSGRRLDKPTKGVNIVGGKLVIK
ncbi:MAG: hypothetical protein J6U97_04370 [Bacteroidaceae bacterium]|nr:hypothetical protein [Bacteroidaceae bacterium]